MTAAAEFEVPKSIPMTLAIFYLLCFFPRRERGVSAPPHKRFQIASSFRILPVRDIYTDIDRHDPDAYLCGSGQIICPHVQSFELLTDDLRQPNLNAEL
jgi:hypothetical protein